MIIDRIKQYYDCLDDQEQNLDSSCGLLKIRLLYLMTVMNENLLNILTGIATGFSINIFTNFVTIDTDIQTGDLCVWIIRFISAIVFNYCIVKLTVYCTLLRSKARVEVDKKKLKLEYEYNKQYRIELRDAFETDYRRIRICAIVGVISAIILFAATIIYPIFVVFLNHYNMQQIPITISETMTNPT